MTSAGRRFQVVGDDAYQLLVPAQGVALQVDRLRRDHHELVGELTVACKLNGARTVDGMLSVATFNLSSATARVARAKLLAQRSDAPDVDWETLIEELCIRVIAHDRQGAPARPLHTYTRPEATSATVDIHGWPWPRDHAMMTFGDGGSLKSLAALYGAGRLSQAGITVGYVDWELCGEDHRDRLARLFPDNLPLVHYLRCDRPLIHEVDRVVREVRRLGLEYLVFDSAGFGAGGAPEAAEEALAYFRAVRQIGVGSHHLAHVNRSENGDQKPFGSVFWHNSARATWYAKQTSVTPDGQVVAVGLYCRKSNLTRQAPAIGLQFDFRNAAHIVVTPIDVTDVDELARALPLWQRLKAALTAGPRPLAALVDELETSADTLDKTIRRRPNVFRRLTETPDGKPRIALVSRREAP